MGQRNERNTATLTTPPPFPSCLLIRLIPMFEALEQQLAGKESLGSGGVQFIQSLGLALRFMRAHEEVEKNILNPAYLTLLGPQGETFVRECSAFHEKIVPALMQMETVAMGMMPSTKEELHALCEAIAMFTKAFSDHSKEEESKYLPMIQAKMDGQGQNTLCADFIREMAAANKRQGLPSPRPSSMAMGMKSGMDMAAAAAAESYKV